MRKNEIWVVTGASGGMGSVLVDKLLASGRKVAAFTRTPEKVERRHPGAENLVAIQVDICSEESVRAGHEAVLARFGRYDVLVNTAGYALDGALEEISDAEAREAFNVNLFGMLNVCRIFVPGLREQGEGCVINFGSIDSIVATPNHAVYSATKFAADALTDALNKEAGQFGIAAICVKSGPMQTDFISHKIHAKKELAAYASVRRAAQEQDAAIAGREKADPEKVADLLIRLSGEAAPPKNLYLTRESVETARRKWTFVENEFEEWKWATLCVDYPREECYHGKRG